jgi:membrane associated rhomboid family serine protease
MSLVRFFEHFMGIYDRDYTQQDDSTYYGRSGRIRWGLPRTMPVVMYLLVANAAMFVAGMIPPIGYFFQRWLAVDSTSMAGILEIWRLITYQFLHGGFWHIFFNMINLFFFGSMLEGQWGSKRFLRFYLICGAAGGVCFILLSSMHLLYPGYMIGASGAILGVIAACAILYPHSIVYFWFFPMTMRVLAIIMIVIAIFGIATANNAGGQVAHLAGMATGAIYIFSQPAIEKLRLRRKSGRWEQKMAARRNLQIEVDRILEKVHNSGIGSLSRAERKTLQRATREEQMKRKN